MSAEKLLSSIQTLRDLKAGLRDYLPGLRLAHGSIMGVPSLAERMQVIKVDWKLRREADVLADPTASYKRMTDACRSVGSAVKGLYRMALEWEDADLERAAQAVEEVHEAVASMVFGSVLWGEYGASPSREA